VIESIIENFIQLMNVAIMVFWIRFWWELGGRFINRWLEAVSYFGGKHDKTNK